MTIPARGPRGSCEVLSLCGRHGVPRRWPASGRIRLHSLKAFVALLSVFALFCFSAPQSTGAADQSQDTFSIVVTPKIISDFNNPLPSVKAFYDNYESTMTQFTDKIIVLAVGSGEHIYQYPGAPAPPVQTRTVFADTDIGPWGVPSNTQLSLSTNR